ncbi:MAG: hypothetical protein NVS1B14_07590 [Vulcanimicrobiaceae bacterium]
MRYMRMNQLRPVWPYALFSCALGVAIAVIFPQMPEHAQAAAAEKKSPPVRRTTLGHPVPLPSPEALLAKIRQVFRAHRPPPPFVTYTLTREQKTEQGYPDFVESYTYRVWCRTSDRAALGRRVYRDDYRGPLEFQRPAFNEPRDPGPPTADVFEPAPAHPHPIEFVPTPEPNATAVPLIGSVRSVGETQYRVTKVAHEGEQIHVSVTPIRDPERNRLRDIFVDAKTLELRKLVATDRLFIERGPSYGAIFTITLGMLEGRPVVTDVHGEIGDGYVGDGQVVDFTFRDIAFPSTLPEWYFDPHAYAPI